MTRSRHARFSDLTESWDSVDGEKSEANDAVNGDYFTGRDSHQSRETPASRSSRRAPREEVEDDDFDIAETPTRITARNRNAPREPEFVMPSSPDGARRSNLASAKMRASTPHFRLNERSLTSDVGKHNHMRASTPHFRAAQRSLTSDAGLFKRGGPRSAQDDNSSDDDNNDNDDDHDEYESESQFSDKRDHSNSAGSSKSEVPGMVYAVVRPLLAYCRDVVGLTLNNLKPLLGYILLAYMLVGGIMFALGFIHNSVNSALTPICRIPGAKLLRLPFCPKQTAESIQGPAEFDRLMQVQSAFDEVLSGTAVGASLPLDMKRSEASIRDLKHVVQYSTLPSRNELVFEFGGFVDTARQASQDLSRFNTRIGRALDHILSTNRWTLSVIEGVNSVEESRGSIGRWVGKNLNIFAPFQPVAMSRDLLLDQYLRHTSAVEEQILSLISEAQALLTILDNLDGRLDVIASIAMRDGLKAEGNKEELFAHLWTKLGGNRNSVQKLEQQIALLKHVGAYRRLAWAHITSTIVKLQAIRDNLEDLRERVALPEIVGTDRVPLEVHINSINLGIERLEKQRENSRQIEADNHARLLSKADGDRRLIEAKAEL